MAILFPFQPDWNSTVRIDHAFQTEIITSRNYKEQRIALRLQPRKSYEFTVQGVRGGLSALHAFLAKNLQGEFVVRDPTRFVEITAQADAATLLLETDGAPFWAIPGQTVQLVNGTQTALVEIDAVDATDILVTVALAATWPVGTRIYATFTGTLNQQLRGRLLTNTAGDIPIRLDVNPGSFEEPDGAAVLTYNDRELFLTKPNWGQAPSAEWVGYLESVDFGRGLLERFSPVSFQTRKLQFNFNGLAEKAEAFTQFFRRMKGQRGEFYMPTWEPDIDVGTGAAETDTFIIVPGSTLFDSYAGSTVYKHLILFFRDGTHAEHEITSIVASGSNSRINVSSGWTRDVNAGSVRLACFLPVWRFSVDSVAMNWETNTVARWQATMQTLEDLA